VTGLPATPESELWIVDSVGEAITVLVLLEDEAEPIVVEVSPELLPDDLEVGGVIRVPLGLVGEPLWEQAKKDRDEEPELPSPP